MGCSSYKCVSPPFLPPPSSPNREHRASCLWSEACGLGLTPGNGRVRVGGKQLFSCGFSFYWSRSYCSICIGPDFLLRALSCFRQLRIVCALVVINYTSGILTFSLCSCLLSKPRMCFCYLEKVIKKFKRIGAGCRHNSGLEMVYKVVAYILEWDFLSGFECRFYYWLMFLRLHSLSLSFLFCK